MKKQQNVKNVTLKLPQRITCGIIPEPSIVKQKSNATIVTFLSLFHPMSENILKRSTSELKDRTEKTPVRLIHVKVLVSVHVWNWTNIPYLFVNNASFQP